MTPAQKKLVVTVAAAILGGLAVAFPAYAVALTGLSGLLMGSAHVSRPGDTRA